MRRSPKSVIDDLPESRPAAAVVADALRKSILRQATRGGERLRQDAIAVRFDVSQTIVREAFRQLVIEGFLKAEPRRGVSVAVMTAEEALEMTQLRSVLEAKALEWAIPAMTREDLDGASRLLAKLDRARTVDQIILLNARFHETIYRPANRERTLALVANLRLNFERYLRFTWAETPHLEQSQREHRQILDLCEARQIEEACALLRRHIAATGDLLITRLQDQATESPTDHPAR